MDALNCNTGFQLVTQSVVATIRIVGGIRARCRFSRRDEEGAEQSISREATKGKGKTLAQPPAFQLIVNSGRVLNPARVRYSALFVSK